MTPTRRHILARRGLAAVAVAIVAVHVEVFAAADLSGRLIWTYQQSKAQERFDSFLQHYQVTLTDRLFETHALSASVFLDSRRNLTREQTTRLFRGQLNLTHKNYTFTARGTPRQTITPLEIEPSREFTDHQVTFDLHVPRRPRLRLFYGKASRYELNTFVGSSRDFRGTLTYDYKFLYVALNRWYGKSDNGRERTTSVTGGVVQLRKTFRRWLNVRSGYDHQLTETSQTIGPKQSVLNQTLTASVLGNYLRVARASLGLIARRSTTEFETEAVRREETVRFRLTFFPYHPVNVELLRDYSRWRQPGLFRLSDYATVQVLATLPRMKRFSGRAQVARRFEISRINTGLPANLYFLTLTAQVYRGIVARADLNVTETIDEGRFQTLSLLDLFLRPRDNVQINPFVRHVNFSDHFTLLNNDRRAYGLTLNYIPRPRFTIGTELRRTRTTTGRQREDTAATLNASLALRNRTTVNVAYGINSVDEIDAAPDSVVFEQVTLESRARTFNIQAQVWILPSGSLSLNYSSVNRKFGDDAEFFGLTYRQDF